MTTDENDLLQAGKLPIDPREGMVQVTKNAPQERKIPDPISAKDLLAQDLPEPRWAVPGLIPVGVTILAGRPKTGKSWAALGAAIAVASETNAFKLIPVERGEVMYLALEDTKRRLQDRLRKILGDKPAPDGLHLWTEWKRLPDGGSQDLDVWLGQHPDVRLVIIDTWAKIRGPRPKNEDNYSGDYTAVGQVKTVADKRGVAVVLVHHERKSDSEDIFDSISGTLGLTGAADALLVLKHGRGDADGVLHITGRDLDEQELAMRWDASTCIWEITGDAPDARMHPERQKVLRVLKEAKGPLSPRQIADLLGRKDGTIRQTLRRMAEDDQVKPLGGGLYTTPLYL